MFGRFLKCLNLGFSLWVGFLKFIITNNLFTCYSSIHILYFVLSLFWYFFFFNKFIYLFIYLFILGCIWVFVAVRAFSSCSERGLLFVVVRGLFIVVASLVAEHGL